MNTQIVRDGAVGAQPDLAHRFGDMAFHWVMKLTGRISSGLSQNLSFTCGGRRCASLRAISVSKAGRQEGGRHCSDAHSHSLAPEGGGHIENRLPFWMAATRRALKLLPSRSTSTS